MVQPFDVPEIVCLICERTQRSDLARLLTTSRLFFNCAAPLVWKDLPKSAPVILMKLLPNADKYLNTNLNTTLVSDLCESLQPLGAQSLVRFNLYTPHVKRLIRHYRNKQSNLVWDRLLKLVDARPILPNLEALKVSLCALDGSMAYHIVPSFSAFLSSTLVEIDNVSDAYFYVEPQDMCDLVSSIAQKCPHIRSLKLANILVVGLGLTPMATINASELADSLGRLRNLRVFGLGSMSLELKVLRALSTLPHLESLILNEAPSHRRPNHSNEPIVSGILLPDGSFPALQHLGVDILDLPVPLDRTWCIAGLAQCLASVTVRVTPLNKQNQVNTYLRAMCRSSPFVTDLCLDNIGSSSRSCVRFLFPELVGILAQLPLQCLWLLGRDNKYDGERCDGEQLALAFPKMEYLRITGYYFTFQDLASMAKHMPRLQQLSVKVLIDKDWPSSDELSSLAYTPSPSQLYLHLRIFRSGSNRWNRVEVRDALPQEKVEAIASSLQALWPNGVVCETDRRSREDGKVSWTHEVNAALRRLHVADGYGDQLVFMPRKYLRKRIPVWHGGF